MFSLITFSIKSTSEYQDNFSFTINFENRNLLEIEG